MMAALSSRPSAYTFDLPAPDSLRPSSKRGRSSREPSSDHQHTQPLKKQKVHLQHIPQPQAVSPTHTENEFSTPPKVALKRLRKSHDVRLPLNGAQSTDCNNHLPLEGEITAIGSAEVPEKVEARNLRSHDGGSRSKSELALYFSNYDEILSMEARDPEFLTTETPIYIIDEPFKSTTSLQPDLTTQHNFHKLRALASTHHPLPNGYSSLSEGPDQRQNNAQRVDFSSVAPHASLFVKDPLCDGVYLKAHRRAERAEKQFRNIEKERAQHEKVQLERILDGLRGHDWLRAMGITGITESEKKLFESKRDYFIQEVSALIEKFRVWKEEEKRRKAEKEQNQLVEGNLESEPEEVIDDASEADALATKLPQEARLAMGGHRRKGRGNRVEEEVVLPAVEKPFTSFYSKAHIREAAIGKHRRGRARFAFGQPLPEVVEKWFELPQDMLSLDALRASARSRRRARREGKDC